MTRRAVLVAGGGVAAAAAVGGRVPIPATGCWFGADDTTRGFTTKTGIETELGRRMAIRNRRYGWLATCPSPQAVADAALTSPRVVVMCSFGQPSTFPCKTAGGSGKSDLSTTAFGTGIDRITNGEFDSYWSGVASRLNALGGPVIVRLWQEPDGRHNPYRAGFRGGVGTGGEQAYIKAWRHVRSVFAAAHGKPYMVSESGFVQGQRVKVGKTSYDKDGSVTGNSLILNTYQSVMQNPWVVAYLPWNNSGPNGVAFVDTSTKSLAQYKQWANDPYFGLVLT